MYKCSYSPPPLPSLALFSIFRCFPQYIYTPKVDVIIICITLKISLNNDRFVAGTSKMDRE